MSNDIPRDKLKQSLFERCVEKNLTPYFVDGYHSMRPMFWNIKDDTILEGYRVGMVGWLTFRGAPMEKVRETTDGLAKTDFDKRGPHGLSSSNSVIVDCYENDGVFIVEMLNGDLLTNINFAEEWREHLDIERMNEIADLLFDCTKEANGSLSYGRTKALVAELKERGSFSKCEFGEGYFDRKVLAEIPKGVTAKMQELGIKKPEDITKENYHLLTHAACQSFESAMNDRISAVYMSWAKHCVETQKPIYITAHGMKRPQAVGIDAPMIMHGRPPVFSVDGKEIPLSKIWKDTEFDYRAYVRLLKNGELTSPRYIDLEDQHILARNEIDPMGEFKGATFIELDDCIVSSVNLVDELRELSRQGLVHIDIKPKQEITNEEIIETEQDDIERY